MKRTTTFLSLLALSAGLLAQSSVKTERQYLSGRGCDDMVQWDFIDRKSTRLNSSHP